MQFSITSDCLRPPGTRKAGAQEAFLFHLVSTFLSPHVLQISIWQYRQVEWPTQIYQMYSHHWREPKCEIRKSIFLRYLLQKTTELGSFCVPTISCYSQVTILVGFRKLLQQNLAKSYYTHILILFWGYIYEVHEGDKLSSINLKYQILHIAVFYLFLNRSVPGGIHRSILQKQESGNLPFYPWLSLNYVI